MQNLRTVVVLEHELIPVIDADSASYSERIGSSDTSYLTIKESEELLRLNDRRAGFCQRVHGGIKLAQHCGIVRLSSCVLEVLPKVGMTDARDTNEPARARGALLTMLSLGRKVHTTKVDTTPQNAVRASLLEIFIEEFLQCALEQARFGLLTRYVPNADDLRVVKGRFSIHGQTRRNLGRPHLLHCEYDDFTADNPYNRAIRAALNVCRPLIRRDSTQRLWFEMHARFAGVSNVRMSARHVRCLPRERMTKRYASVLTWCEWILAMFSPALSAGSEQAPGLLFDMNKLFEDFVGSTVERQEVNEQCIVRRNGPPLSLARQGIDEAFTLKPDITVWKVPTEGGQPFLVRVLDAKWKRLDSGRKNWKVDEADIYQLLAYASRYRCKHLELVYPRPDGMSDAAHPPIFKIGDAADKTDEITIQVSLIPMWV
jgi:5-methylcytosine-specific restriction enzyme subunit McrC